MRERTKTRDAAAWISPPDPHAAKSPGYDEWLKAELDTAAAQLDAGEGIPAAEVWKQLGIE